MMDWKFLKKSIKFERRVEKKTRKEISLAFDLKKNWERIPKTLNEALGNYGYWSGQLTQFKLELANFLGKEEDIKKKAIKVERQLLKFKRQLSSGKLNELEEEERLVIYDCQEIGGGIGKAIGGVGEIIRLLKSGNGITNKGRWIQSHSGTYSFSYRNVEAYLTTIISKLVELDKLESAILIQMKRLKP